MPDQLTRQLQETLGAAYTIGRELGGGGMSRVFVAEEHRLKRKVVVKVLSPELAQGLSVDRFEREIQTAAALQQANIVTVLTAGETQGLPFYTMPFVEGESLRARLGRGPLPVAEVVGIVRDVAKALAYAHRQGVVHRDIKPDNVLLSEGTAVVTDFGIAKAISAARTDSGGATLTQIGTSIGTPAYMAPEQAAGDPAVDQRADIYSLGAMAYELLTGQAVFAGRTPQRTLAAHMTESPRAIAELRADLPLALADLVMRSLAKSPDERPQTASDVVRVLETVTSGGSMQAMPALLLGGPRMFWKALAIYAASFALVALVARAAIVGIGLPDWVFPGSLVVMALGLPVVLWTGYVQRVTRRAVQVTPTFTPGGTPSAATHGTMATLALKAAPHVSWYRTARGGMYALGAFGAAIAAFMGMRELGVGPFGSLAARGQLERRDQVLITDFRTANTDSTLGRVMSDAVRAGLAGSNAFTLVTPNTVAAALGRMALPRNTRVDSGVARQIALREGVKAIVDGEITGVDGGYIVAVRLIRADSSVVLASFHETGEGPRGLIDAADKLSRALRSRAGESLRDVNATPPLSQATTASLEALRKYSEAARANALGDSRSIDLNRQAVAIDSTFASGWSALAATLSNYGSSRAAIDSAMQQAFRYRDRVSERERALIIGRYYSLGPGRDRARAIAAYQQVVQQTDSTVGGINLGESLRAQRRYAEAEALNAFAVRLNPNSGTALGNLAEMQMNQGKFTDAAATVARLRQVSTGYGQNRHAFLLFSRGEHAALRVFGDSLRRGGGAMRGFGVLIARVYALMDGRVRALRDIGTNEDPSALPSERTDAPESVWELANVATIVGNSPALSARIDKAIAQIPLSSMAMVDRPYLELAGVLAKTGNPEKARAMIARYRIEVTDTSIRRSRRPDENGAEGHIALAENRTADALRAFRLSDVGEDGEPADECAPCMAYDLARTFEVAGQPDSAIVYYEQYLATPYWLKMSPSNDPVRVPRIRERLGALYEQVGNATKAAENHAAFIALWKNADPELQPRVRIARERLRRLSLDGPR